MHKLGSSEIEKASSEAFSIAERCAREAMALSNPNPRVGCAVVNERGHCVAFGHTQHTGGPHAEVMALRSASVHGITLRGATVYVTLEPCSHHGRTPPCCDALIEAGIAKVVVAVLDPNPLVAGRGVERLRAAGIEVQVLPTHSEPAHATRELNIGFFSRMLRATPWVRLKMAASLDGTSALHNGTSQWITGEAARADGHAWRARACAVLTGIGTVLEDDPVLDVRLVHTPRQPHLVIVDSSLQTPPGARLFQPAAHGLKRNVWIYCAAADPQRQQQLEAKGATVTALPSRVPGFEHKVDLAAMLADLARREVNELHVEAGHKLNGSLVREGLVDECLLYLAPKLLGPGKGLASFEPLTSLNDALDMRIVSIDQVGEDARLLVRVKGRDAFLHPAPPVAPAAR